MQIGYMIIAIVMLAAASFAASNSTSSVVNQSYTPPSYLSVVIGILLVVAVIFIGFVFIKSIIKTIIVLIVLIILASVAYSFFTTGSLTLAGSAGLINSILGIIGDIAKLGHPVAAAINSTSKPIGAITNITGTS